MICLFSQKKPEAKDLLTLQQDHPCAPGLEAGRTYAITVHIVKFNSSNAFSSSTLLVYGLYSMGIYSLALLAFMYN